MSARDPIGELVLLARGAAEAGADWRLRLQREWLPQVLAATPHAVLVAALADWQETAPAMGADLSAQLESAVLSAMAEQGY
jgi:hypothetical protein